MSGGATEGALTPQLPARKIDVYFHLNHVVSCESLEGEMEMQVEHSATPADRLAANHRIASAALCPTFHFCTFSPLVASLVS